MAFEEIRPGGFVDGTRLLASELNDFQNQLILKLIDGYNGGIVEPAEVIDIRGAGLTVSGTGLFTANDATITTLAAQSADLDTLTAGVTHIEGTLEVDFGTTLSSTLSVAGSATFTGGNHNVTSSTINLGEVTPGGDKVLVIQSTGLTLNGSLSLSPGAHIINSVFTVSDVNATIDTQNYNITYIPNGVLSATRTYTLGAAPNGVMHTVITRELSHAASIATGGSDGTLSILFSAGETFSITYLRVGSVWLRVAGSVYEDVT